MAISDFVAEVARAELEKKRKIIEGVVRERLTDEAVESVARRVVDMAVSDIKNRP